MLDEGKINLDAGNKKICFIALTDGTINKIINKNKILYLVIKSAIICLYQAVLNLSK
tara:strand:+ start:24203 stop:24373 length:171 start_codon:yes stop_codon:yes gene_type:complete